MKREPDHCTSVVVDGETLRVRGGGELTAADQEALAEIVRAAKAKFAAEQGHPVMGGEVGMPCLNCGAPLSEGERARSVGHDEACDGSVHVACPKVVGPGRAVVTAEVVERAEAASIDALEDDENEGLAIFDLGVKVAREVISSLGADEGPTERMTVALEKVAEAAASAEREVYRSHAKACELSGRPLVSPDDVHWLTIALQHLGVEVTS